MNKYQLKPEVAEKYEVVGDQLHAYFPGWGEINLTEMTLDGAADLVSKNFPYLKEKAAKSTKSKTE
jgi:hypothetical protein